MPSAVFSAWSSACVDVECHCPRGRVRRDVSPCARRLDGVEFPRRRRDVVPVARRLDGNLTHCLISTQTPTKSKPKDSWTRVRCRLAHDEGATGATRDEAGAAASATSKAALLAIFVVPGAGSLSQRPSSAAPKLPTLPPSAKNRRLLSMMCVILVGLELADPSTRWASAMPPETVAWAFRAI